MFVIAYYGGSSVLLKTWKFLIRDLDLPALINLLIICRWLRSLSKPAAQRRRGPGGWLMLLLTLVLAVLTLAAVFRNTTPPTSTLHLCTFTTLERRGGGVTVKLSSDKNFFYNLKVYTAKSNY
jgi:hypothetical protein